MRKFLKILTVPVVFILALPLYYFYYLVEKNDIGGSRYRIYPIFFLFIPAYLASCLVPKEKNIWIFGSIARRKFAENSKYLFLYIQRNHPEIRPIWLTGSQEVLETLSSKGFEVYKTLSLKGFFYSMQAGCVVVNCTLGEVNRAVIGRAKKIQLWHGIPLKKIAYKEKSNVYKFLAKIRNKILPFVDPDWDVFIATSEENVKMMDSVFLLRKDVLSITGFPRNDALFETPWLFDNECDCLNDIKKKTNFTRIFTYLPTHRLRGKKKVDLFGRFGFKVNNINTILEELDAILVIKAHPSDYKLDFSDYKKNKSRIYIFSDQELPDPYPLLKKTDILLTDYSSVYFDFLLLDRPIIFTPFDFVEYEKEEGFLYDYNEVTPGPKAKNWQEVFALAKKIMVKDDWGDSRKKIRQSFIKFQDNKNSERVLLKTKELIDRR